MTEGRRLDFVGVGAARCGTTWLARCLDEHPEIAIPPRKELHFFNNDKIWTREGVAGLDRHFDYAFPGKLGEFTPRYLLHPQALERIHGTFPKARILLVLRDPVRRALSQYTYFRFNKHKEPCRDFFKALKGYHHDDYIRKSLYADSILRLRSLFPGEQIWVGLFEEMTDGAPMFWEQLFRFLGVEPGFLPPTAKRRVNASEPQAVDPSPLFALINRSIVNSRIRALSGRRVRAVMEELIQLEAGYRKAPAFLPPEPERLTALFQTHFAEDVARVSDLLDRDLGKIWGHYSATP